MAYCNIYNFPEPSLIPLLNKMLLISFPEQIAWLSKTCNSLEKFIIEQIFDLMPLLLTYGMICSPQQLLPAIQSLAKNKSLTTGSLLWARSNVDHM